MTLLEGAVFLLLLLLSLPGLFRYLKRPSLLYPSYIVAGALAGALMEAEAILTWRQMGQFGFILLLFSVGLEIELPEKRESFVALRRAVLWMALQGFFIVSTLHLLGIGWLESLVAAFALTSTSVGMAYVLWLHHPFPTASGRQQFLQWMVAIEVVSILGMASLGPALEGVVWWYALLRFLGLLAAAGLAAFVAVRLVPRLAQAIARGTNIEVPLLVALLFAICALGDRLGLSAPKTAFVLGLFISRSTGEEVALNHRLEPLRDQMFVPVFFFGVGTLLRMDLVLNWGFLLALGAGVLLFWMRRYFFTRYFKPLFHCDPSAHAVAAPMLTLAAVAVEVLAHAQGSAQLISWILAASLALTLSATLLTASKTLVYEPSLAAPEAIQETGQYGMQKTSNPSGEVS